MPRPLSIYKSAVEQDPSITSEKIKNLLGEIAKVSDKAHKCLAECIKLLTTKDRSSSMDAHTVDLGVRVWNDFKVTSELVNMGFYLQAMMVLRDTIEIMAIIEYLHSFPDEADNWWKAKTLKERRRFGINAIKNDIKDGQAWKDSWDLLSSYVHPNSKGTPAYGADKPYYGHNLFLGGFYYPGSVEWLFSLQLLICIKLLERMKEWYEKELKFPEELSTEIDSLENEYHTQIDYLEKRTELEKREVVDKVVSTRLSEEEVIEWFRYLDNLS